eukprot:scaffold40799_cov31-Cyclotella_meneghiniana.AAC.8
MIGERLTYYVPSFGSSSAFLIDVTTCDNDNGYLHHYHLESKRPPCQSITVNCSAIVLPGLRSDADMNFIAAELIIYAAVFGADKDTPCVPEYTHVLQCLFSIGNDACFTCIIDAVHQEVQDNTTFSALVDSNFCGELRNCAVDVCDIRCGPEWSTLYTCAEEWAEKYAEDAEICPGLEKAVGSASGDNVAPINIHDFVLPFNCTDVGVENMASV